jgi:hypothetical protein
VVEALRRRDCSVGLAWCHANSAKLKKVKSKLEFNLRIQVPRGGLGNGEGGRGFPGALNLWRSAKGLSFPDKSSEWVLGCSPVHAVPGSSKGR